MNDECRFHVSVEIRPMWLKPPESPAHQAGRSQAESRFDAFAYEVAAFIEAKLEQMRRDHGDNVHNWILPVQRADGSWWSGGGDSNGR
jgi:hypothetical protein